MVYGTEAVLPAEIGQESARIMAYGANNQELRAMDLDLLEEHRSRAAIRLAAYRKRMTQAYNKRVYPKVFQEGDLVIRKIQHPRERGKLEAKYEGPFKVIGKAGITAYYLEDPQEKKGKRPWNAQHLKKILSLVAQLWSRHIILLSWFLTSHLFALQSVLFCLHQGQSCFSVNFVF
ncbi:uncharacterized protein [Henckelia pumila]|uniref:uncharacterized protein n=1 Tax=Henckelia pumila TaxID=405737 RepID=UPI003C6DC5DC